METGEIVGVVFACIGLSLLAVVCIMCILESIDDAKKKRAKVEEDKAKLQCRVDKLEYYINVLWWERENKKKR